MTIHDDEINTNAEYEPIERLDEPEDENGDPVDPIEQNQSEEILDNEGGAKKELREGIEGDIGTKDDE